MFPAWTYTSNRVYGEFRVRDSLSYPLFRSETNQLKYQPEAMNPHPKTLVSEKPELEAGLRARSARRSNRRGRSTRNPIPETRNRMPECNAMDYIIGASTRRKEEGPWFVLRVDGGLFSVEVGAAAEDDFGGFHDGFAEGGVGVDGQMDVAGQSAHFDGEGAFGDEFAGA